MKIVNEIFRNNLIKRCRTGDKNAFKELVKPYGKSLFGYFIKITQDEEAAKDLMQETLIKIWKGLENYNEKNKFRQWVFSIAHNVAVDYLRRASVELTQESSNTLKDQATPLEALIKKEEKELLNMAIETLPLQQKEIVLLRYVANLKFKEIAEALNLPLNTVLSGMHYAKIKLKKFLSEEK